MLFKRIYIISLCTLLISGTSFAAQDMDIDELYAQKKRYETLWLKELAKRRAAQKKHRHYKRKCNKLMKDNEKLYRHYRNKHPRRHPFFNTYVSPPLNIPLPQPAPLAAPQAEPTQITVESINYNDVQRQRPVFDHWMYNDH